MSELPKGWTETKVAALARPDEQPVLTGPFGTSMGQKDFVAEGCPVLTIGCLTDAGISLKKAVYVAPSKAAALERYRLRAGDLLFSRMASVGRAAIVPHSLDGALFNYHIMRLRLADDAMRPELFLAYVRGAPAVRQYLEEVNHGATRDGINTEQLLDMPVLVPPATEQRRIVAKLEGLLARSRRAKDALDAVPPLLEKLRQSILAAAFRGDLTAEWRKKNPDVEPADKLLARIRVERRKKWEEAELAKMKAKGKPPTDDRWKAKYQEPEPVDASELPELPDGWCWGNADLCAWEITVGHVGPMESRYVQSGVPFLRSQNVRESGFDPKELRFIPKEFHDELSKSALHPGDLVVVRSGAPGTACVIPEALPAANCADLVIVRLTQTSLPDLMALYVNGPTARAHIFGAQVGMAQQHFNVGAMRLLPLPVMPLGEQEFLLDKLRTLLASVATLGQFARSVVQRVNEADAAGLAKAFRGDLVAQDPNDEPAAELLARLRREADVPTKKSPRGRSRNDKMEPA